MMNTPKSTKTSDPMSTDGSSKTSGQSTTEGVLSQAKQAAQSLIGQTKEQIGSELTTRKEGVTEKAHDVAAAIREAGQKLGVDKDAALPNYANQAADQIEAFSSYVRSRNVGQLIGDVEGFARREPAIFLGGAFALGLVAARFLKASSHRDEATHTGAASASSSTSSAGSYGTYGESNKGMSAHTTQPLPVPTTPQSPKTTTPMYGSSGFSTPSTSTSAQGSMGTQGSTGSTQSSVGGTQGSMGSSGTGGSTKNGGGRV